MEWLIVLIEKLIDGMVDGMEWLIDGMVDCFDRKREWWWRLVLFFTVF